MLIWETPNEVPDESKKDNIWGKFSELEMISILFIFHDLMFEIIMMMMIRALRIISGTIICSSDFLHQYEESKTET